MHSAAAVALYGVLAVLPGWGTIKAIRSGRVRARGGRVYHRSVHPFQYWLMTLALAVVWGMFTFYLAWSVLRRF